MARKTEHEAGETLLEIQSFADGAAEWIREHWIIPAGILAAIVVLTGLLAGLRGWREHEELAAADGLATIQRSYLATMGAQPGSTVFEEPANPETGKKARRETADALVAFAKEHSGTAAAALAQLEAGTLLAQAGNGDQAIELWRPVLAEGQVSPELKALIHVRIAQADEAAGRWADAAKAYQEAGEQRAYPLWPWAMADAARSLVEAGQRDQAVRIAERLQVDAPAVELPPHLAGLLEELRSSAVPAPKG